MAGAGGWPAPGGRGHGFVESRPRRSSRMSRAKGKEEPKDQNAVHYITLRAFNTHLIYIYIMYILILNIIIVITITERGPWLCSSARVLPPISKHSSPFRPFLHIHH